MAEDPMRTPGRAPHRPGLGGPWWGFPLLLGTSCALLVLDSSAPGWSTLVTAVALLLWIPLGLLWLARVALRFSGRGRWRDVVVPPVVVLATLGVAASGVPLQLRFAVSRGALDELVRTLPPDQERTAVERWVGAYRIRTAAPLDSGVALGEGWVDDVLGTGGFAYLPGGLPDGLREDVVEPRAWTELGGGWWAFSATR